MLSFLTPYLLYIKIAGIAVLVLFTSWATHKVDMGNIANARVEAANEAIKTLETRAEVKAQHEQAVQNAIEKAIKNQVTVDDAFNISVKLLDGPIIPSEPKAATSCEESKKLYSAAWQFARELEQSCRELQREGTTIVKKGEQINLSAIQANESE